MLRALVTTSPVLLVLFAVAGLSGCEEVDPLSVAGGSRVARVALGWTPVGELSTAREGHQAVPLPGDRALIIGGLDAAGVALSSTEVFDGASLQLIPGPPLGNARWGHRATLLGDGRILVSGGMGPVGATSTTELYDPALGVWQPCLPMTGARFGHSAVALTGGTSVLVAGGAVTMTGASLSSSEIYDSARQTWQPAGIMAQARQAHEAALLSDGRIFISGGANLWASLRGTEIFDPSTSSWLGGPEMVAPRVGHAMEHLSGGRLLVVGGETPLVEIFSPLSGSISAARALGAERTGHSVTAVGGGRVLLVGGDSVSGPQLDLAAEVLAFEEATDTWLQDSRINTARQGHQATLLSSGRILISGGSHHGGRLASLELSRIYGPPDRDGGVGSDAVGSDSVSSDGAVGSDLSGGGTPGAAGEGCSCAVNGPALPRASVFWAILGLVGLLLRLFGQARTSGM